MTITATCRGCAKSYRLGEKFFGKRIKCKECGQVISVPTPPAASSRTHPAAAPPRKQPARPVPPPASHGSEFDDPISLEGLATVAATPAPMPVQQEAARREGPNVALAVTGKLAGGLVRFILIGLQALVWLWALAQLLYCKFAQPDDLLGAAIIAIFFGIVFVIAGNIGFVIVAAKKKKLLSFTFDRSTQMQFIADNEKDTRNHFYRLCAGIVLCLITVLCWPKQLTMDNPSKSVPTTHIKPRSYR